MKHELKRFTDRHGAPLTAVTRRFSAVDARHMPSEADPKVLTPVFTLADQLTVDPNPLLVIDDAAKSQQIAMSKPEIAVALSHIEVWRLVANGDVPSALILEDDVFFPRGFGKKLSSTWASLTDPDSGASNFDLLYLSFTEVGARPERDGNNPIRRERPGIWQASAYVLTRAGAQRLLSQLPAHGPIDLWLNLQFQNIRTFTASKQVIEQRIDGPSSNSYSILPILSQLGVLTAEKPALPVRTRRKAPIIALGEPGSGLSSLAKALSMLGYTCCSDLSVLPGEETDMLRDGSRRCMFNAYVNIGTLDASRTQQLARSNRRVRVITTSAIDLPGIDPERILDISTATDIWAELSAFLDIDYPTHPYPKEADQGLRELARHGDDHDRDSRSTAQLPDETPWVLRADSSWRGLPIAGAGVRPPDTLVATYNPQRQLDEDVWRLREDTFPSNLSIFSPNNFIQTSRSHGSLVLDAQPTRVREFTAAAIASRQSYRYGTFRAVLKPSDTPGLITGFFLHRNGPRQEIDIEFLGKDTTKILVNVFYNPGPSGTKLEYGYIGTPALIELGFDAATEFHTYEIEWHPDRIVWRVDGSDVHVRHLWQPTPIPDQPLELNLNLWHSRSIDLAGRLDFDRLPSSSHVRHIEVFSACATDG